MTERVSAVYVRRMPTTPVTLLGQVREWAGGQLHDRLVDWSTASQAHARRNALVATTACAQRRAERDDVEAFLAARYTDGGPLSMPSPSAGRPSQPPTRHAAQR